MNNIEIIKGDITQLNVDCIINSANPSLMKGGGMCGAIFDAAGTKELTQELSQYRRQEIGSVIVTKGYNLPSNNIMHVIAPRYYEVVDQKGNVDISKLAMVYKRIIIEANEREFESIAIPSIGTGIYGWPFKLASMIAIQNLCCGNSSSIKKIIICLYDDEQYEIFKKLYNLSLISKELQEENYGSL